MAFCYRVSGILPIGMFGPYYFSINGCLYLQRERFHLEIQIAGPGAVA